MAEPVIFIRPVPFGSGFDVVVEPALPDGRKLDREFADHRAAYGYAVGLRMTLRLPVVDQAGEGA